MIHGPQHTLPSGSTNSSEASFVRPRAGKPQAFLLNYLKKYLELNIIINTIKDIKLDNNPYSSNIEYNKLSFDEFKHKTEQNQIQLNNLIIFDILNIAINNSDNDLILEIITDSCVINTEIISLLINYYNCEKTTLLADNICRCCNQQIIYNIIKKDNK